MVRTTPLKPLDKKIMDDIGMSWHTDTDGSDYISNDLLEVSEAEAEDYYQAANTLYDMYVQAGEYVIEHQCYADLAIPSNLVKMIEHSWEQDDWHLYGRFDLAGGIDGQPIKLIEFNADTPTSLFETAIIQWALLKANGMDEDSQFNNIHESLQENFRRLITREESTEKFSALYKGQPILFSSIDDLPEDERTVRFLQELASAAGFYTDFAYLHEVGFSEDGVFNKDQQRADFWFKLFPWEDIAADEIELTRTLEKIALNGQGSFINPAYTLLFQSKGILKILYDLFPDSPYLLRADYSPLSGVAQVEKRMFGREGANVRITDRDNRLIAETDGEYGFHKSVFQEYRALPEDEQGRRYQAGVFFAGEACGLGFRRGSHILDDMSKFVSHRISNNPS